MVERNKYNFLYQKSSESKKKTLVGEVSQDLKIFMYYLAFIITGYRPKNITSYPASMMIQKSGAK